MKILNLSVCVILMTFFMISCDEGNGDVAETTDRPAMREGETPPQSQLDVDIEIIQEHMREQGLAGDRTASGLHYVMKEEGTGQQAQPGKTVAVHYEGFLLDGTKFDSSLDRGEPIEFELGQGMVIQGWDEGIALLKEGGKATLFIPSPLAYGTRGAGDLIQPNSVLKFDVELVAVR